MKEKLPKDSDNGTPKKQEGNINVKFKRGT
jgi:hypothetical protein